MLALGADHGGYQIKEAVRLYLEEKGIAYKDFGVLDGEAADYPEIAKEVAKEVAAGKAEKRNFYCGK